MSGGPSVRDRSHGNAILTIVVFIVICASLSAAVLLATSGATHETDAALDGERAFQMADAGIDWGIARLRRAPGTLPADETVPACAGGEFTVEYVAGTANDRDDDGDGAVDNAEERNYSILRSVGRSGGIERRIEVTLRAATCPGDFQAAIQFNVLRPQIDLRGNALVVSGAEHFLDGTLDESRPAKPGIGSPAEAWRLGSQISAKFADNVTGSGSAPSVARIRSILAGPLARQAAASASVTLLPGTHAKASLGTPTAAGVQTVYCAGDLHLSGHATGAGLLVVDGDLRISGDFAWTGLVVVRGTVTFTGGGQSVRLVGALVADEAVGSGSGATSVTVGGTVDVLYSSDAIDLATRGLSALDVLAWREIGLR